MVKSPLSKRIGHTLAVLQHMSDLSVEWALRQTKRVTDAAPETAATPQRGVVGRLRSATKFVTDLWEEYLQDYGKMKRK